MRLEPGNLVFGTAPAILLDCARQLHDRNSPFSFEDFCEALGAPGSEATPVLQQLIDAEIIEIGDSPDAPYVATEKLGQLALARISRGLSRIEAEVLLARVIEKARGINDDAQRYLCEIVCLVVFGSFLGDKTLLGDLDIGVHVGPARLPEADRKNALMLWLRNGRQPPEAKSMSALRLRKPNLISLHSLEEVLSLGTPYRVVFGSIPETMLEKRG
jgi:hypothetical protein